MSYQHIRKCIVTLLAAILSILDLNICIYKTFVYIGIKFGIELDSVKNLVVKNIKTDPINRMKMGAIKLQF